MDAISETLNDLDVQIDKALDARRPHDFQLLEYGRYTGLLMARDALIRNRTKATLERLEQEGANNG